MSRRKKGKPKDGRPPASSFLKIRQQFADVVSGDFPHSWFTLKSGAARKPKSIHRKKYHFPYTIRHRKLIEVCDGMRRTINIDDSVPTQWCQIFHGLMQYGCSDDPEAEDLIIRSIAETMANISPEEFRTGSLGNRKFNRIAKILKIKPSTPSIRIVLDNLKSLGVANASARARRELDNTPNGICNHKAYISCDPWDIFRMGVGRSDLGSCMNIIDGGYVDQLMQNFQDPCVAIAYIENPSKFGGALNGMVCRCLIRILFHEGRIGIVMDRFYPEKSEYRSAIARAIIDAAKDAGLEVWRYASYLHSQGEHFFCRAVEGDVVFKATTLASSYLRKLPYPDQEESGGWVAKEFKKRIIGLQEYEVIDTHE